MSQEPPVSSETARESSESIWPSTGLLEGDPRIELRIGRDGRGDLLVETWGPNPHDVDVYGRPDPRRAVCLERVRLDDLTVFPGGLARSIRSYYEERERLAREIGWIA